MEHLVFCYGTLKKNERNNYLLRDSEFVGNARTTTDYKLYDNGSYPCLVKTEKGNNVEGEVWRVDQKTLAELDLLEGVEYGLYERIRIKLLNNQSPIWAYLYLGEVSRFRECGTSWGGKRDR
jgi:gamma-glutamylcyclotransferase (GGCT)/AIG2-like uncharacterized protein YtfP